LTGRETGVEEFLVSKIIFCFRISAFKGKAETLPVVAV